MRTCGTVLLAAALPCCGVMPACVPSACAVAADLAPLRYDHPGLVVDLGVGLWAWPMPCDADGVPDFLGGAEDGRMYLLKNPRAVGDIPVKPVVD